MLIDPAKKLKNYQNKNKPNLFVRFIGNVFIQIMFTSLLVGLIMWSHEFIILWYKTLITAIK